MTLHHDGDPTGLHRVLDRPVVLPQAAQRLDTRAELWPDEVRVAVERLNLDAASFRQLQDNHGRDPEAIRAEVLAIITERGKMQNPVTGSGGMLIGTVDEVGPAAEVDLAVGRRVATLVSLTLTPLVITDGLADWDAHSEQVPCRGHAILFGRTIAAVLPDDLEDTVALSVMDVCGAPALTRRTVAGHDRATVLVIGGGGKSGSLSLVAARDAGAAHTIAVVPTEAEAERVRRAHVADEVVVADARDPVALATAVEKAGGPADVTVVCVDVGGCEGGAVLATAPGGTVIFFSMATDFAAAALGAEGLAADVTMLIGNGYVPGHAAYALDLFRAHPGLRTLFEGRH